MLTLMTVSLSKLDSFSLVPIVPIGGDQELIDALKALGSTE